MMSAARLALSAGLVASFAAAAAAQVPAFIVAKQGDTLGESTIAALNSPFTDGNGKVGFVVNLADSTRSIWYGAGTIFNSNNALPNVLVGSESTMGVSNTGQFIYSPSFNGNDAVYTNGGKLLADTDAAPGFPGLFNTFNSRPRMLPNGTSYWVGGTAPTSGGSTTARVVYKATDPANPATISVVSKVGDVIGNTGGAAIAPGNATISFDYAVSDNDAFRMQRFVLNSATTNDDVVAINGLAVAREGNIAVGAERYQAFGAQGINNSGNWLLAGDTDGSTATDFFLSYNGTIALREGQTLGGITLGGNVRAASINNLNQAAHMWAFGASGEALFAGDAANLAASTLLLKTGDTIDVNGDNAADWTVTDFKASNAIGPGLDLGEDGYVYAEVDLTPIGGGAAIEAVIRLAIPTPGTLGALALAGLAASRRRR